MEGGVFDKKGLLECKPEWNREAITVFSRLPSLRRLQATPPLQTSLPKQVKIILNFLSQNIAILSQNNVPKYYTKGH